MKEFEMIAKTFQGLEDILAKELISIGANNIIIGNRMVSFSGNTKIMYKANFHLRTAIRILKPFLHFKANTADEVYSICKNVNWENYMSQTSSFAVDSVVNSENFRHSKFVAYRVKDAIADYFREKTGKRPNVSVTNPDLIFHIHISHEDCSLSLDSSGESLHRRGYRQEAVEAPLNEVLAAGMILMTGWHGECDFVDPMCGSGTIPIEAALIARNMAPGLFRKRFAFEKWNDFDKELFETIYNDDSAEKPFNGQIFGFDKDPKAIATAKRNAKAAGLTKEIEFKVKDIRDFTSFKKKSIMVVNPPYGERFNVDDLFELYSVIGERLKHAFQGNNAWIISYRYECFEKIGLKPSVKIPLFNGALPCEFRKYELFSGKYNEFRKDGSHLIQRGTPTRRTSTLKQKARTADKKATSRSGNSQNERNRPFQKDRDRPIRGKIKKSGKY
ncbi:MAG TPA: class I SAM-dependent RNA methyltransferase [Bacteroidaceae bacterium]|nr:class I SAM-dependent RNA methyltransferase [Bacteroidaceae bacterium]